MLLNTPACDFGWKAPDFSLFDFDEKKHTMSKSIGEKGLLIAFICNHCPYVKSIAERLADDANYLIKNGINILAVMSNDYHQFTEDSPENMRKFSSKYQFDFPYLIDESQSNINAQRDINVDGVNGVTLPFIFVFCTGLV